MFCLILFQIVMNVKKELTIVTPMPCAVTLREASLVLAMTDTMETV